MRVLLVPFHPTNLIMVVIFGVLLAFCVSFGSYGWIGALFLQIWVFKYCFVLVEAVANGATEPPVMDLNMLSPTETRPWIQAALFIGGYWLCKWVGGSAGVVLAIGLLALLPATVAILGFGEPPWQAVNPLTWFRVIRGLGSYYAILLVALLVCTGVW
ncbi:MAG: hypothetical protein ABI769_13365, partial [Pseudomonadota bacterium]